MTCLHGSYAFIVLWLQLPFTTRTRSTNSWPMPIPWSEPIWNLKGMVGGHMIMPSDFRPQVSHRWTGPSWIFPCMLGCLPRSQGAAIAAGTVRGETILPVPVHGASMWTYRLDHLVGKVGLAWTLLSVILGTWDSADFRQGGTGLDTPVCYSWNMGFCRFPNSCNYCHICSGCRGFHRVRECPNSLPRLRPPMPPPVDTSRRPRFGGPPPP